MDGGERPREEAWGWRVSYAVCVCVCVGVCVCVCGVCVCVCVCVCVWGGCVCVCVCVCVFIGRAALYSLCESEHVAVADYLVNSWLDGHNLTASQQLRTHTHTHTCSHTHTQNHTKRHTRTDTHTPTQPYSFTPTTHNPQPWPQFTNELDILLPPLSFSLYPSFSLSVWLSEVGFIRSAE